MLPDNCILEFGRLHSLSKQLASDQDLLVKYNDIMCGKLKVGVVEKMTEESSIGQMQYYLSHQPVQTPQRATTKLSVVYDASAKTRQDNQIKSN